MVTISKEMGKEMVKEMEIPILSFMISTIQAKLSMKDISEIKIEEELEMEMETIIKEVEMEMVVEMEIL